jgi:hypothetical protein
MKHFFSSLLIIILSVQFLFANNVDIKRAQTVAVNSYSEKYQNYYDMAKKPAISITDDYTITENGIAVYYIFNTSNTGFIIISADDIITPVLGYSFQSTYSETNQPPQFIGWMKTYALQISDAISTKLTASAETISEWNRLSANTDNFNSAKGIMDVAELLTTTWDQGSYYNGLCPLDAAGPSGRVYAGCVATAMGQVINYYKYPLQGQGSHSYTSNYGTLSANFGTTTYEWDAMPNHITAANTPIATLLYHCGVSVDMNYAPDGSGAMMYDAANSLKTYFKYSSSIQSAYKSNYSTANWENLLKAELDNNRPTLYSGSDPTSGAGHAWVCDGYQGTNYFHFNWGWSGYYNGFFYLDNLNPGGNNLTSQQSCIYNIKPGTGYPYYCSPTKTLTANSGTFNDGSGPVNDYQNNTDCSWLIAPTLVRYISLSFDNLNTEAANDLITIYDGPDASSTILGTYSGSTLPSSITSTSPSVFVSFTSNSSTVSPGWQISYTSAPIIFCNGTTLLTAPSDTFSDGSGGSAYSNSANCKWRIEPSNAASVTLSFSAFETESTNDFVKIYDPTSSTLLATLSGSSIPSPITSTSGKMLVLFSSDLSTTSSGWNASYTSLPSGISETKNMKEISVFPNPSSSILTVSLNSIVAQNLNIEIINSIGQIVYTENIENTIGNINKTIHIENYPEGIYTLRINSGNDNFYKKLIIE